MKQTTRAAVPVTTEIMGEESAWRLLQALAARAASGAPVLEGTGVRLDERGQLCLCPPDRGSIVARPQREQGWEPACAVDDAARVLFDLYAPLCVGPRSHTLVVGHLGQSLDGRVATVTGASRFVTGQEDLCHTHRLRALFDAVLIGAQTASCDDPQLTTRLVPGSQPTRVVLDPSVRLDPRLRILSDRAAPTIVVTATGARADAQRWGAHVELLQVPAEGGMLEPRAVLDALRGRGLSRIFIEGGGVTISRFLQAGALDRLQLAIAPKIIGSGTPALQLRPIDQMADAITAVSCRRFALGVDMLFDCDLRSER
jgi:diaminohydroxyphosphoribosylaminopyrimidine deaminase / 5-amino-6-(5-phosphoribosylamino)uracil reductase